MITVLSGLSVACVSARKAVEQPLIGVLRSCAEAGVEQVILNVRSSQTLEEFRRFAPLLRRCC